MCQIGSFSDRGSSPCLSRVDCDHPILHYAVLVNPVVYISEGLRAALTPSVPHMQPAAFLSAMIVLLALLGTVALRLFVRRVTT